MGAIVWVPPLVRELVFTTRVVAESSMQAVAPATSWSDRFLPMFKTGAMSVLKTQLEKPLFKWGPLHLEPSDSPLVFSWTLPLGGRVVLKYAFMLFSEGGAVVWYHFGSNKFNLIHNEERSMITLPRATIERAGEYYLLASVTDSADEPLSLPGIVKVASNVGPVERLGLVEIIWSRVFLAGLGATIAGLLLTLFALRKKRIALPLDKS